MSSHKDPGWSTPLMIVLIGGLALYSMTRGPSCPANTSRPNSATTAVLPSATDSEAALVQADDTNFDETVLQADGPVLVDFYADWCGPCQQLAPTLERISQDLTHGRIVKVDTDRSPEVTRRYNIQALPTLLLFVNGQVVERTMGFQDEQTLRSLLQR